LNGWTDVVSRVLRPTPAPTAQTFAVTAVEAYLPPGTYCYLLSFCSRRPPNKREVELDRFERLDANLRAAGVYDEQPPTTALEPEHLQRLCHRIQQPAVAHTVGGVEWQLFPAVHLCSARGEDLTGPIGNDRVGAVLRSRVMLHFPSREIGHSDFAPEPDPGLVEDHPTTWAAEAESEWSTEQPAEVAARLGVRRIGSWGDNQLAVDDLADESFGDRVEVVPGCDTSRRLRHRQSVSQRGEVRRGPASSTARRKSAARTGPISSWTLPSARCMSCHAPQGRDYTLELRAIAAAADISAPQSRVRT
jgi:hypothetical protein